MPGVARRGCFLAFVAIAATAAGCLDRHLTGPVMTFVHPNGLSLTIATMYAGHAVEVKRTPAGFVVDGKVYHPSQVATVEYHPDVATPPGDWPKTRSVRGTRIHFAVFEDEGGSAGAGFGLRAWEPTPGGGHISYASHDQGAFRPDFGLAWDIVEGTRWHR